jgi:hypothetical protein
VCHLELVGVGGAGDPCLVVRAGYHRSSELVSFMGPDSERHSISDRTVNTSSSSYLFISPRRRACIF